MDDANAIIFICFMLSVGLIALAPFGRLRKTRHHARSTENHPR